MSAPSPPESRRAAAAAALFIFFWASGFIAAKYGFPYAEPFTFLAIRFVIGSADDEIIGALAQRLGRGDDALLVVGR